MSENIHVLSTASEAIRSEATNIVMQVDHSTDRVRVDEIFANPLTQEFAYRTIEPGSAEIDTDLIVWRSVTSKWSHGFGERVPSFRVSAVVNRPYLEGDPECKYRNWKSADLAPLQHIASIAIPIAKRQTTEAAEQRREEVDIRITTSGEEVLRSEWVSNPNQRLHQLRGQYSQEVMQYWHGVKGVVLSAEGKAVMQRALAGPMSLGLAASSYLAESPALYKKSWAIAEDVPLNEQQAYTFLSRLTSYGSTILDTAQRT
jgi:hypothetical protein